MQRIFAIGDIHGCSKTFKKLLLEVIQIRKSDKIYCIGDYVDRGIDSKGVIDFILELRSRGFHIHTLRGNHEEMMLESVENEENLKHWFKNGGEATLRSFGISSMNQLPEKYFTFLKRTKHFIINGNYIFVHAGLNFSLNNPLLDLTAMLWTREIHFDKTKIENKIVIHGHTPIPLETILNQPNPHKINIDGGCKFIHRHGYGNLIALSLPDMKFIAVRNIDG